MRLDPYSYDYRLSADSAGQLALYGQTGHDLIRVDPATGRSAVTHLPLAGFPHSARIQDLRFTDTDQVVYSLVELDDDSALIGCQAWQMNLETGESRLLARRQSNEVGWGTRSGSA